ncbi:hypothetical protein SRABI106_02298 [Rahnella aquatilis]|nr:hypothetical protein SRABI106_02298 [Rahnella aquatilis]
MRETLQGFQPASGQRLAQPHIKTGFEQPFVALIGPLPQFLQGGRADFTTWRVNDAQECAVVVRIGQHTQIGQQIFNLRSGEEGRAAGNPVRDAVLHQHFFKQTRLVVTTVQNRVIAISGFVDEMMSN